MTPRGKTHRKIPGPALTVGIVEDDEPVRETIARLIDRSDGLRCIGSYGSSETALAGIQRRSPDVLLMDIGLPGKSGIECTREVKRLHPSTEILILTVYEDEEKILQSLRAGATGYILKNAEPAELIRAIREIKSGAPMSASIARRVLNMISRSPSTIVSDTLAAKSGREGLTGSGNGFNEMDLTAREIEILDSLVEGLSYKRIAEKLFISPFTVHSHIKRIYEKLHVHSMSAAVSKALKHRFSR